MNDKSEQDISPEFELAAGMIMAKMILADGEIEDAEIDMMCEIYEKIVGKSTSTETIEQILDDANSHPFTAEEIAKDFAPRLDLNCHEQIMKAVLLIAMADGRFEGSERQLAGRIGRALGMSSDHMRRILSSVTGAQPT